MTYSLKQISQSYGRSYTTTLRHVNLLKKKKLFVKTSLGTQYTQRELNDLERLLEFTYVSNKPQNISLSFRSED